MEAWKGVEDWRDGGVEVWRGVVRVVQPLVGSGAVSVGIRGALPAVGFTRTGWGRSLWGRFVGAGWRGLRLPSILAMGWPV